MITIRLIERLWDAKQYRRLCQELLAVRPEYTPRLEAQLSLPSSAAALAIVRLDELSHSHVPVYSRLVRRLVNAQDTDGGWSDPLTTALCLRALLCGRGDGEAIERGLSYLANLQKSQGSWPAVPIRRLPADAFVSAFILFQLGERERFRAAVRFDDAVAWFEANETSLDEEARPLWDTLRLRHNLSRTAARNAATLLWS